MGMIGFREYECKNDIQYYELSLVYNNIFIQDCTPFIQMIKGPFLVSRKMKINYELQRYQ